MLGALAGLEEQMRFVTVRLMVLRETKEDRGRNGFLQAIAEHTETFDGSMESLEQMRVNIRQLLLEAGYLHER